MAFYTSRFSNQELRSGRYTAVRISLGTPRWPLGYRLDGAISGLMPLGLFKKFDNDPEAFKREYRKRLNEVGVDWIQQQLSAFATRGKDVVLLCYEDIRKGGNNWCHSKGVAQQGKERQRKGGVWPGLALRC